MDYDQATEAEREVLDLINVKMRGVINPVIVRHLEEISHNTHVLAEAAPAWPEMPVMPHAIRKSMTKIVAQYVVMTLFGRMMEEIFANQEFDKAAATVGNYLMHHFVEHHGPGALTMTYQPDDGSPSIIH